MDSDGESDVESAQGWSPVVEVVDVEASLPDTQAASATPRAPLPRLRIVSTHSWRQFAQHSASTVTYARMGRHVSWGGLCVTHRRRVAFTEPTPGPNSDEDHDRVRVGEASNLGPVQTCQARRAEHDRSPGYRCMETIRIWSMIEGTQTQVIVPASSAALQAGLEERVPTVRLRVASNGFFCLATIPKMSRMIRGLCWTRIFALTP